MGLIYQSLSYSQEDLALFGFQRAHLIPKGFMAGPFGVLRHGGALDTLRSFVARAHLHATPLVNSEGCAPSRRTFFLEMFHYKIGCGGIAVDVR